MAAQPAIDTDNVNLEQESCYAFGLGYIRLKLNKKWRVLVIMQINTRTKQMFRSTLLDVYQR